MACNIAAQNGVETDPAPLPAFASASGAQHVQPDQASQLASALLLAYCQPAVGAFFNFELIDENRLGMTAGRSVPELAIEVVYTSSGIDMLEAGDFTRALGARRFRASISRRSPGS